MSVWKEYLQSLACDRLKMKHSLVYQDDADIAWVYAVVSDSKLNNHLKLSLVLARPVTDIQGFNSMKQIGWPGILYASF